MDLRDSEAVLLELVLELGGVKHAVGAASLDDLGLLLESEVLPGKVWANVLLEEGKDLVVRDGTWVGEIVDTGLFVLGEEDGTWKEVVEDGVGVWHVNDLLVLGDLGNEVTAVEIIGDWHSQAENEDIWVVLHDLVEELVCISWFWGVFATNLLDVSLRHGVEGAVEVGLVSLEEAWATDWVLLIISVDAASGEDSAVNALEEAAVGQVKGTDNVIADGILLVVLAPVDVWASSGTGTVEDVGWLDTLELSDDSLTVLHANSGGSDLLALGLEESLEVASDPALTSPDEEGVLSGCSHCDVCVCVVVMSLYCGSVMELKSDRKTCVCESGGVVREEEGVEAARSSRYEKGCQLK